MPENMSYIVNKKSIKATVLGVNATGINEWMSE